MEQVGKGKVVTLASIVFEYEGKICFNKMAVDWPFLAQFEIMQYELIITAMALLPELTC